MAYLFTSESVSEGHPDKVADQISDALIDNFLAFDATSKVACETLVTTGQVVLAGEVKSKAYLDVQKIARDVINKIGYTKGEYMFDGNSCGVLSAIHEQSPDINQGVERAKEEEQGAGDQGMMFGYATTETENFMPLPLEISHLLLKELAAIRREGKEMTYLRPDSKSQVTIAYDDDNNPIKIDAIVVSTQHDEFASETEMLTKIKDDVINILVPRVKALLPSHIQSLFNDGINYLGKSVLQKQKEEGVTRSLVGLKLQINEISLSKTLPVFYKDELIGDLRSACFSPQFQCCLGIAMINVSHHNFSESLNLTINGQEITTEITSIPFTK